MLDGLNLNLNPEPANSGSPMNIELKRGEGSPLRISITIYVAVQLIMGAFLFGGLYNAFNSRLDQAAIKLEEADKRALQNTEFQKEVIRQLAILQTDITNLREEFRYLRNQNQK